jgi:hypothetical protein
MGVKRKFSVQRSAFSVRRSAFGVRRSAFGGAVRTSVTLMGQDILVTLFLSSSLSPCPSCDAFLFSRDSGTQADSASWQKFRPTNPIPLCVLCDLCAMLSPSRGSRSQASDVPGRSLPLPIPICVLRDLCAMLSFLALRAAAVR